MSDTKRSPLPKKSVPTSKTSRPGSGCSLILGILLLGLVVASALFTPRLLTFLANQQAAPPAPLHDRTSSAQMLEQRQQAIAQLDSYGWVNQASGIVHIPIARAIALIAEKGLPSGPAVAAGNAPAAAQPATGSAAQSSTSAPTLDPAQIDFKADVLPIFEQHCTECHGNEDPEKGLQLTNYSNVMAGSENGPVITPGDPQNSYLVEQVVKGRMPKRGKKLTPEEIATITAWVQGGATEKAAAPHSPSQVAQATVPKTPTTSTAVVTPTATVSATQPISAFDPATINFKTDVLPIFEQHCTECHGYEDPEKGLQLTSYSTVMDGSENGPVIEPGNPEKSYLVEQVIKGRMPKRGKKLTPDEIAIITAWVKGGALETTGTQAATSKTAQSAPATPKAVDANTATATATPTVQATATRTRAATQTTTATSTATATQTGTATPQPAVVAKAATTTPTATAQRTATRTTTATKTPTATPKTTATMQETATPTATVPSQTTASTTTLTTTLPVVDPATVSYRKDVQPIFEQHCLDCHGYEDAEKGLQLTGHSAVMSGSENGPVIEPGNPEKSYLVEQITKGRMPKRGKKLTPEEIAIITAWVKAGAPDN